MRLVFTWRYIRLQLGSSGVCWTALLLVLKTTSPILICFRFCTIGCARLCLYHIGFRKHGLLSTSVRCCFDLYWVTTIVSNESRLKLDADTNISLFFDSLCHADAMAHPREVSSQAIPIPGNSNLSFCNWAEDPDWDGVPPEVLFSIDAVHIEPSPPIM